MLIDRRAKEVLKRLQKNNIEAYIVGGAVRDYLLKKRPHDYDVCYNADIQSIYKIFKGYKIYETGIKYGTVTLNFKGLLLELTRFRTEEAYTDNRHPEKVKFVDEIEKDLLRRDFTINALALDCKDNIIDKFGGKNDLENGIIRAVGNPHERFLEDALRILRAIRFAARLNFEIEDATKRAIEDKKQGLCALSRERITEELKEILKGKHFNKIYYDFLSAISPIIKVEEEKAPYFLELLRRAGEGLKFPLFVALFNCEAALRLSNKEQKIVSILKEFENADSVNIPKLFLSYKQEEIEIILEFLSLKNALSETDKAQYATIIKKGLNKKANALKIDGNDLMNLGFKGTEITEIKQLLMALILEEKIKNKKALLMKYVNENYKQKTE